jgi:hypothetical protein
MQPEDMFAEAGPTAGIPAMSEAVAVFLCASLLCVGSVLIQRVYCARRRLYKDSPMLPIIDPSIDQPLNVNLKHRILL